jgi:large subunit ribosomal protein L25
MANTGNSLSIKSKERTITGKKVRFLRRNGIIPGNLYGDGLTSKALEVSTEELKELIRTGGKSGVIDLHLGNDNYQTILKKIDVHPVTRDILHVEFHQIDISKKIQTQIPVHITGEAPASKLPDALLNQLVFQITVECLPINMISSLEVDISSLEDFDMSIQVKSLPQIDGIDFIADENLTIVRMGRSRVASSLELDDAAAAAAQIDPTLETGDEDTEEESTEEGASDEA